MMVFCTARLSSLIHRASRHLAPLLDIEATRTVPRLRDVIYRGFSRHAILSEQHQSGPYGFHYWTGDDDTKLIRLRDEGVPMRIIARDHFPNRTAEACHRRLSLMSSRKPTDRASRAWTEESQVEFRRLHAAGFSVGEIVCKMDRPTRTVVNIHRSMGLRTNKSPPSRNVAWTGAEDDIVARYIEYGLKREDFMAELQRLLPNRTEEAIQARRSHWRRQRGITQPKSLEWHAEEDATLCAMYNQDTTPSTSALSQLAETLGRTSQALLSRAYMLRQRSPSAIRASRYPHNLRRMPLPANVKTKSTIEDAK